MINTTLRVLSLGLVVLLAACGSAPEQPQSEQEPIYSVQRMLPDDVQDPTKVIADPWQGMNQRIYNFNYHFDQKVFLPATRGYKWLLPDFMQKGVHNFFNNWRDLRTLANSILQLAPDKAAQSTGRIMVNTTVGLLGFIDVAHDMGIPRPTEDFGQTLGHWGVGTGPYLVVPFLGPSNLRDGVGLLPDFLLNSWAQQEVIAEDIQRWLFLIDAVDTRAALPFRYYETGSAFEYDTLRWLYTTKRELDVAK
jgi:phospholipid-binding lipoprotein MlaA